MESLGVKRGWTHPRDILKAFSTLGELTKDPNRTDLIGDFIGLLSGPSSDRLLRKVWNDPMGRSILEEGPDLRATLADRTYLSSLPAGSLGRTYFDWTSTRNFTADGIAQEVSKQVGRESKDPRSNMSARVVDMHDLWHVLNGWDSDIYGEVHLLVTAMRNSVAGPGSSSRSSQILCWPLWVASKGLVICAPRSVVVARPRCWWL